MSERIRTIISVVFGIVLLFIILVFSGIIPRFWACNCDVSTSPSSLMMEFCYEVVSPYKEYCSCLKKELSQQIPDSTVEKELNKFKYAYENDSINDENAQAVIKIIKTVKVIDTSGVCNTYKR